MNNFENRYTQPDIILSETFNEWHSGVDSKSIPFQLQIFNIIKRNANAFSLFSLNAIADVRLRRRHEMIFLEYLGNY